MVNIYISTDMEGIAETLEWADVRKESKNYKKFQTIQNNELTQIVNIVKNTDYILIA